MVPGFLTILSPAEALEPELIGDSKVSLNLPVSFAALRQHLELSSEIAEAWMLLRYRAIVSLIA